MGFIPPPHAFSVNVVGYACDRGVNELSTSTSKQLAWGLPGSPARSQSSLLLAFQGAHVSGRRGGVTVRRGRKIFLFHRYSEDRL